ncbi:battenin-like isoform X2 [Amphiura filiformis]|uniref:battenin-like isoform X2 n=1 Tax=Amphiura filiformis TaxID=82378 RepID=UPI003B228E01
MEDSGEESASRSSPNFRRNWFGFFILGLANTLPYAIVSTAANTIADSFDKGRFVATVYGAGGSATIIVKAVNTFFLTNVSYGSRILVNSALMLIGLAGLAFANSFILAIFAIVLVGAVNAFGENVALGYLARFDGKLVNAWSSGTGMAGLAGAAMYVLFGCLIESVNGKEDELQKLDRWAFMLVIPAAIAYLIAFFQIIREPASTHPYHPPAPVAVPQALPTTLYPNIQQDSKDSRPLLQCTAAIVQRTNEAGGTNEVEIRPSRWSHFIHSLPSRLKRYKTCLGLVALLAINLGASQFLSYVIRTAGAQARHSAEYDKGCPELYASLQLCFQAGVFTSRSSVQIVRIRKVAVLNILQGINMIVWILNQQYKFIPVSILPAYMIYVGLLSGAVYVNVFYMVQTDSKYKEERELCVNITAIFITVGISLSCILQTILFNTVTIPDSKPHGLW